MLKGTECRQQLVWLSVCPVDGQFYGHQLSLRVRTVLVSGRLGLHSAGQPVQGSHQCVVVVTCDAYVPSVSGTQVTSDERKQNKTVRHHYLFANGTRRPWDAFQMWIR